MAELPQARGSKSEVVTYRGVLWFALAWLALVLPGTIVAVRSSPPLWVWVVCVLLWIGAASLIHRVLSMTLTRWRLVPPQLWAEPLPARPGQGVRLRLTQRARLTTDLSKVEVVLLARRYRGEEGVRQGRDQRLVQRSLDGVTKVSAARPLRHEIDLLVPPDAPTSPGDAAERVIWVVQLRLRLVGWPDYLEERELPQAAPGPP